MGISSVLSAMASLILCVNTSARILYRMAQRVQRIGNPSMTIWAGNTPVAGRPWGKSRLIAPHPLLKTVQIRRTNEGGREMSHGGVDPAGKPLKTVEIRRNHEGGMKMSHCGGDPVGKSPGV